MKKVENLIWGAVFIVIGLVLGLNALGVTNIDIFFDGWWSLFIIVPSVVSIIKNYKDVSAYIWLAIGIALLLSAQGILDMSVIGKLILPAVLVAIGVGIIFKDRVSSRANEEIDELNKSNKEEFYATFSGQKLNFAGDEFKGVSLNAIFGGIDLDLKNANIVEDKIINATSVFGGINIFVPENVNIQVKSTSIFGGVNNKTKNKDEQPTIYVKAFCLFGGVDIK